MKDFVEIHTKWKKVSGYCFLNFSSSLDVGPGLGHGLGHDLFHACSLCL